MAEATSLNTKNDELWQSSFATSQNMLHGVRDGLVRDANNYGTARAGLPADPEQPAPKATDAYASHIRARRSPQTD